MTSAAIKPEPDQSSESFKRFVKRTNFVLLLVLAALILGPVGATWWLSRQYPSISTIKIKDLRLTTPLAACPGDKMTWHYILNATGAGNLVDDQTIWRETPPRTLVYSKRRYFSLKEPIDQDITETWRIDREYLNPETDEIEPFPPGDYARILAISSPSKSTIVDIQSVTFTVKAGCD